MQTASPSGSDRWQQLEALFNEAVELDAPKRQIFLDEVCSHDPELRGELEALLKCSEKTGDFLEDAVGGAAHTFIRDGGVGIAIGTCLDHYKVVRMIGTGGMSQVYLAEDLKLKRKVALKVLPPQLTRDEDALRRFEQEAQAISSLNHPNLLTIFEFCQLQELHFIVTEFVEGRTLRQLVEDRSLNRDTAIEIAMQIASALSAAHSYGVIHRDIKPENVIVRPDGVIKVLDFGIAKLTELPGERGLTPCPGTLQGTVIGTPKYMSPEQARGVPVDLRTDLFSLGAVLYEILSGKAPFEGETQSDLIAEILKSDPPPLSQTALDVPKELEHIVVKALHKNRESRYQSAKELLSDLRAFQREADFRAQWQQNQYASEGTVQNATLSLTPVQTSETVVPLQPALASLRRWILAATALAAFSIIGYLAFRNINRDRSLTQPRSLAVLPFRNVKQDPQTEFLGFSLADAVIGKLGYLRALTVRPSSSVERYRENRGDLQKIATDLKVDLLLTGNFIKDGEDLRITTELIDVRPDTILWQDTLTVKYDRLLTVQDRVAELIIKGLELRLSPVEAARFKSEPPVNSLAYEYFLRGVDLYSIGNFRLAVTMLEKSATLSPDYAPTWAHLGRAYTTSGSLQFGGQTNYGKAQAAYEKAMALDPGYPAPRIYMANLFTDTGRVEQAVPLLKVALQNSPNNAEAHWELGYAYRFGGMLKESVQECELARQLDPEVKINSSAFNTYLYLGEYDKFLQSLPVNDSSYLLFYRGFAEYYKHNWKEAAQNFNRAFELAPNLLPAQVGKALERGVAHRNGEGFKLLQGTEQKIDESGVKDAESIYKVAQAYAVLGDRSAALRLLQRSIEGGFFCYFYLAHDPLLKTLNGQPEFDNLLTEARQRQEQFRERFGERAGQSRLGWTTRKQP